MSRIIIESAQGLVVSLTITALIAVFVIGALRLMFNIMDKIGKGQKAFGPKDRPVTEAIKSKPERVREGVEMKYYLININTENIEGYSIYDTTLVVAEDREKAIEQFLSYGKFAGFTQVDLSENFEYNFRIFQCETIIDGKCVTSKEWEAEALKGD